MAPPGLRMREASAAAATTFRTFCPVLRAGRWWSTNCMMMKSTDAARRGMAVTRPQTSAVLSFRLCFRYSRTLSIETRKSIRPVRYPVTPPPNQGRGRSPAAWARQPRGCGGGRPRSSRVRPIFGNRIGFTKVAPDGLAAAISGHRRTSEGGQYSSEPSPVQTRRAGRA